LHFGAALTTLVPMSLTQKLFVVWAVLLCGLPSVSSAAPPAVPAASRPTDDPVLREARDAEASAFSRRARPEAAADLFRLDELWGWLPPGHVEGVLRRFADAERTAPAVAALAEWLLRERALRRLDAPVALASARRLGLLDAFVWRSGSAPHPVEPLVAGPPWHPYPLGAGAGELWLDAFVRPALETRVTLATRVVSTTERAAVLRLGYDDRAKVWLNGDEVHAADASHAAFLDQVAVPVRLRAGDNRLVVEVEQSTGAWRLIARFTDSLGAALPGIEAFADPFGPVSPPPDRPAPDPEGIVSVWGAVEGLGRTTPTTRAEALRVREHVELALALRLPDRDQVLQLVAAEAAYTVEPSARSLRAWLKLVSEAERVGVRALHVPPRPVPADAVYADLMLRLEEAWDHFHARRFVDCRRLLEPLEREAPDFLPALRLRATLWLEVGLEHRAVALLGAARERRAGQVPPALDAAYREALRSAGRGEAVRAELNALVEAGRAGPDEVYQLANTLRGRGDEAAAIALLDRITAARPELWGYVLEAAEMRQLAGDRAGARERLTQLLARAPDEPSLHERLARLAIEDQRVDEGVALLRRALEIDPTRAELRRYLEAVTRPVTFSPPGPSVEVLSAVPPDPTAPAQVLFQHARVDVAPNGMATRQVRRVVRLLTPEGARGWGTWELPYTPGAQRFDLLSARLLRDGEPPRSPSRSDRDLSQPEYRLYYDQRAEVLTFPRPLPGDVLDVTWRIVDLSPDPSFPGYFGDLAWLQETLPRAESVVEIASALPLQVEVVARGFEVQRQDASGLLRFVARGVPGIQREVDMPGGTATRGYVHVSSASDWLEVDRRYRALLTRRDQPDERLAALARSLVEGAATPKERLARLYQRVSSGVRYVGLELGKHSYQPEMPAATLARAYGDCKDKAVLLIAMARAVGITAHLVLARTRPQGDLAPHPASFAAFDHALVYVPALDAFLDPTQDRNEPFALPPPDQDAFAFVVGYDQTPRRLPTQASTQHGEVLRLEARYEGQRGVVGRLQWRLVGQPATRARFDLEADGTRRERAQRRLAERFQGLRMEAPTVTGLNPAFDPVELGADFVWPGATRVGGELRVPLAGGAWRLIDELAAAAVRTHPLVLETRQHREVEFELALPPGRDARLPPDALEVSPFGRFELTARLENTGPDGARTVRLRARLDLEVVRVEVAQYADFRAFLQRVDARLGDAQVRL
jgi:transglutaminase-like putative cysteine protease